jgi:hypothetical protein
MIERLLDVFEIHVPMPLTGAPLLRSIVSSIGLEVCAGELVMLLPGGVLPLF